jgi:catechol 2,3-dioxygenase-like lactoylglutathione lyase family enzyme
MVPTRDSSKAKGFYEGVLGLTVESEDQFALVLRAKNLTVRVVKVAELTPQPFTLLGWDVENVAESVSKLAGRGVVFERFAGMEQDELGIWTVPGAGHRVAWFKDPDGNLLSVSGA